MLKKGYQKQNMINKLEEWSKYHIKYFIEWIFQSEMQLLQVSALSYSDPRLYSMRKAHGVLSLRIVEACLGGGDTEA